MLYGRIWIHYVSALIHSCFSANVRRNNNNNNTSIIWMVSLTMAGYKCKSPYLLHIEVKMKLRFFPISSGWFFTTTVTLDCKHTITVHTSDQLSPSFERTQI